VGLRQDTHPKPLSLEKTPHEGHPEAWVVHIGVTGHQHDIAAVPPEGLHLRTRSRENGRGPETEGPMGTIGEEVRRSHGVDFPRAQAARCGSRAAFLCAATRPSPPRDMATTPLWTISRMPKGR